MCIMTKVKLAIRIRPFTEKELKSEKDRIAIINVSDEHTVTITNMKVNSSGAGDSRERVRPYTADYIFNSVQYQNTDYATQEKIYNTVGQEVLTSISQGLSVCVLAYGQSATGKTYTMMGTESKPGLIPRLCRALGEEEPLDVKVSFLEIYNEKVHDLLVGEVVPGPNTFSSLPRRKGNTRKDLRVREHPSKGPYVQNLRCVHVHDVGTLLSVVAEGARRRSTAATRRNPVSSRSHALLELTTPRATLHLADLAGSEKASWEGCGRGRLKEGANINKSLVALSNVISALVNRGSARSRFVPYRDSALTWLLKDCFTGGGNIFIIATVSPSGACYGESASTLRWASQARCLQTTKAIATTGAISKIALQAQLDQLLSELSRHHIRYIIETGKISYDDKHWFLGTKNKKFVAGDLQAATKIGNIMNTTLKSDTNNTESTNSSAASGSSDMINILGKNSLVDREINKEVDKLIGPALERTRSGSVLEITAPLRHKKRQYCSQEVLSNELFSHGEHTNRTSNINDSPNNNKQVIACKESHVPVLYDNQRAEIIASVTERLYSKFRKEAASNKTESIVDKKIVQPLNELKICANARQRLMELSQKATRNKRRIGIPAHTQTKKVVVRVKDQEIDVQTDLAPYTFDINGPKTLYKDVATETVPITPRYKEVATGEGCLSFFDKSTTMELKRDVKVHSSIMTDVVLKSNTSTQTNIMLPKRKKGATLCTKANKKNYEKKSINLKNSAPSSVININISPVYSLDSDTLSCSDSSENGDIKKKNRNNDIAPDILTHHNKTDNVTEVNQCISEEVCDEKNTRNDKDKSEVLKYNNKIKEDFPDDEEYPLPRVTVDTKTTVDQDDIKNMILGRNMNSYPYNIVLSPNKCKESKTIITFRDSESKFTKKCQPNDNKKREDYMKCDNTNYTFSDTSESSKLESDLHVWNAGTMRSFNKKRVQQQLGNKCPLPMHKNKSACKSQNSSYYKDRLIEETDTDLNIDTDVITEHACSAKNVDKYWTKKSTNTCQSEEFLNITKDKLTDRNERNRFENIECNIIKSCKGLEKAVSCYEGYLDKYYENNDYSTRSPTEYLQYLVNLRKEVVKESISTYSTGTLSSD